MEPLCYITADVNCITRLEDNLAISIKFQISNAYIFDQAIQLTLYPVDTFKFVQNYRYRDDFYIIIRSGNKELVKL